MSDAILVLGPPTKQRVELARQLRSAGISEEIVISVQRSGGQSASELSICGETGVVCEVPRPFTTRGEMLLAAERGTNGQPPTVTVITFAPHVVRARFIFAKCYEGDFAVVAADQPLSPGDWAYQYAYQSVALVKAIFEPCPATGEG